MGRTFNVEVFLLWMNKLFYAIVHGRQLQAKMKFEIGLYDSCNVNTGDQLWLLWNRNFLFSEMILGIS